MAPVTRRAPAAVGAGSPDESGTLFVSGGVEGV